MAAEIEHKFLVIDQSYQAMASERHELTQGYLCRDKGRTVRVRICDDHAFLTVKGPNNGLARAEFEYEVPVADARHMIDLCPAPVIVKTRWIVPYEGNRWEVDAFHCALQGLVTAELEVPSADYEFSKPAFVGREVSDDRRFYNSQLTTFEALKPAL